MKIFATRTSIAAKPERIWALLTNAAQYPRWNSTVERIDGDIARGQRITVHAKINPGRAFPVKVTELNSPERMVWKGGLPFGLFTGERLFTLKPGRRGEIEFYMREEYSGIFAPLITRSIPDLQPAFEQFSGDLKRAAEAERNV